MGVDAVGEVGFRIQCGLPLRISVFTQGSVLILLILKYNNENGKITIHT